MSSVQGKAGGYVLTSADLAESVDEDNGPTALAGIRTWLSGPSDGDTAVVERG